MARQPRRQSRKDVYTRINDTLKLKQDKEKELEDINFNLQELYKEKDELEMRLLLQQMKDNNLDIQTALEKLKMTIKTNK